MRVRQTGFSLLEIAVVLVILGLILGGVLKGQELVSGARVRYLIRQQDDLKIAYFAFFDRYHALAGDYSSAVGVLPDVSTAACNGGNDRVRVHAVAGGGSCAPTDASAPTGTATVAQPVTVCCQS